jgi:FMN phosphatase YigB (HAD superfamily)
MTMKKNTSRAFTHIDTWVFDLDNTLYPHHVNLWQQVDVRIGEFVSAWLKISTAEARRVQKDYYRRYGTTMRGMMTEHGVHADDYLAYVHRIDQKFLRLHGVNARTSAMFEDLARNLVVPHQLGMTTVLVVPDGTREVVREDWELEGRDAAYVDHVTDDLTGFWRG